MKSLLTNLRSGSQGALNVLKSRLDIGDYWYWQDVGEYSDGLEIWPLVFPLRYDILIRKEFFVFYAHNKGLLVDDHRAFMRLAIQHPYYEWFNKVLVVRFAPYLRESKSRLEAAYERRVMKSAGIYDSIVRDGFDTKQPIIPYTAREILPADSGRVTGVKYYMGDGCHRLACLMSLGFERLPVEYIKVKCFRRLMPLDNTSMLAQSMSVDPGWL